MVSPHQYLLRAFALGLALFSSRRSFAAAQRATCDQATSLASTLLTQLTDACALDRSACDNSQCRSQCTYGGESFANDCFDGCPYQWSGYSVKRGTTGVSGLAYTLNSAQLIIYLGLCHTFTAGAEGNIKYSYEGVIVDSQLTQAFRGRCTFTFNGSPCFCEQRYCDEQTASSYDSYIDCTGLEGGSILDLCLGSPAITTESPLLDILFWLPFVLCQGPGPAPEPSGFICFSDRMTVQVKGQGETRMDQLKGGDEILSADGVSYTQVYSFGHLDRDRKADFLQIHTTSSSSKVHHSLLEITADHLLFVHEVGPVPAREVKPGDWLVTSSKDPPVPVRSIQTVQRHGIYAPFTVSGDALVNGFATSNYIALPAAFQPHVTFEQQVWLQHVSYAPFRWYCSWADCRGYNDEETGLFYAVRFWLPILHWLEAQHPLARSGILLVLFNMTRIFAMLVLLLVGYCFIRKLTSTSETTVLVHKLSRKVRTD